MLAAFDVSWLLRSSAAALAAVFVSGCSPEASRFNSNPIEGRPPATGSISDRPAFKPPSSANWTWDGGIALTVEPGETVETIARRYRVPVLAIIETNNLAAANAIRPGQHLVIPRYRSSSVAAVRDPDQSVIARPKADLTIASVPPVVIGDNPARVVLPEGRPVWRSRRHHRSGVNSAKGRSDAAPKAVSLRHQDVSPVTPPPPARQTRKVAQITPSPDTINNVGSVKPAEAAPKFYWPVHGRIVERFGPQADGHQNDGIDVAVPEDTPILAAQDGTVVYAGNGIKSFGNLVLMRHANGYVTAYAHAKEIRVKPGDQIKRGDIIGTAGQTGHVDKPQVHFEIRQGQAPVDPMRFLQRA